MTGCSLLYINWAVNISTIIPTTTHYFYYYNFYYHYHFLSSATGQAQNEVSDAERSYKDTHNRLNSVKNNQLCILQQLTMQKMPIYQFFFLIYSFASQHEDFYRIDIKLIYEQLNYSPRSIFKNQNKITVIKQLNSTHICNHPSCVQSPLLRYFIPGWILRP